MDLKSFKANLDPILNARVQDQINKLPTTHAPFVKDRMQYAAQILAQGGQRIRPYFVSLGYRGRAGDLNPAVYKLVSSVEVLHCMILMVDDIIDHSATRHTIPTVHTELQTRGLDYENAVNQTVLCSDILYSWAFRALIEGFRDFPTAQMQAASQHFLSMIDEVATGEMLDVSLQGKTTASLETIGAKDFLKTATYTVTRPLLIGASLAGASDDALATLTEIGNATGLAFQIMDDLLDITGGYHDKPSFADMQEGQQTTFTAYTMQHGSAESQTQLQSLFNKPLSPDQYPAVRQLFEESGAVAYGLSELDRLLTQAQTLLTDLDMKQDAKTDL